MGHNTEKKKYYEPNSRRQEQKEKQTLKAVYLCAKEKNESDCIGFKLGLFAPFSNLLLWK